MIILFENRWWGHHPVWLGIIARYLQLKSYDFVVAYPQGKNCEQHLFDIDSKKLIAISSIWSPIYNKRSNNKLLNLYYKLKPWFHIRKQIKSIEKIKGKEIDLVFFGAVDDLLHSIIPTAVANKLLPIKWTGIYHRPAEIQETVHGAIPSKVASVSKSVFCQKIFTFHENILHKNSKYEYFPEFSSSPSQIKRTPVSDTLQKFAKGRPIIGLTGLLQRHKGIEHFLELVVFCKEYCFALIGTNDLEEGTSEMKYIKSLLDKYNASSLDNLFTHFEYIKEYDSLLNSFDLIWCMYENFPWSSNTLTKAAMLKKSVIVNKPSLIADRVEKYNLGITVLNNSPLDAFFKINNFFKNEKILHTGLWDEYLEINSINKLHKICDSLITSS